MQLETLQKLEGRGSMMSTNLDKLGLGMADNNGNDDRRINTIEILTRNIR